MTGRCCLRRGEVLGKAHPDIMKAIMNMADMYFRQLDCKKAVEMCSLALDGCEKSLGKDHKDTKLCNSDLLFYCAYLDDVVPGFEGDRGGGGDKGAHPHL